MSGPLQIGLSELAAHYQARRFGEAVNLGSTLARRFPKAPMVFNLLGAAYVQQGKLKAAADCFGEAAKLAPRNLQIRFNLAAIQHELGMLQEAMSSFEFILSVNPSHVEAHIGIGKVADQLGLLAEATEHFREAAALKPDHPSAHFGLGKVLDRLGQHESAAVSYRSALRIHPKHRAAHLNLCDVLEKANQFDAFKAALADAERHLSKDDPHLLLRRGQLALRETRLDEAAALLDHVDESQLEPIFRARRCHLLGRARDRLGDFQGAFRAFERMNQHTSAAKKHVDPDAYLSKIENLAEVWQGASRIATKNAFEDPINLAFIVGFPRSGTTLLDTILRGHPGISVIEEGPMVDRMRDVFGALPTPENLSQASCALIDDLREAYLTALGDHQEVSGSALVIDKLPLNVKDAGLIRTVFPQARFILSLRHPCDAVLSCFMQNFALNDAMANFLDLERTARLYDAIMRLWSSISEVMDLKVHNLRYEELVVDLEGTIAPLIDFLGLDWHDGLADYRKTALSRERINTPSYQQVTERLYSRAAGRWENYRSQIEPVMPLLQPWIAHFGYDDAVNRANRPV